jgi:PAS domain S-box-containing protein
MLVALIILALYGWAYIADVKSISAALLVSDGAAIGAAMSLVLGFISYLWSPKRLIFWGAYIVFGILCATAAILITSTGGVASPFIALWMLICVFAGVFGFYGLLPLFIATTAYLILNTLGGSIGREGIVTIVLTGELPLIVSFLIWHTKSNDEPSKDKAYRELASELSQVAGKSEVVINAIADGVVALDNQGIIQLINPAAQQIIGWGKQDALSLAYKSVVKLVDSNGAELTSANDPIAQVLATNKPVETNNLTLLTNSGKKLLVSVVVSPVGQLGAGVIVVFRDITREKAEERQQAEFISTASHEMRTPVASIEGYLGLALNPATAQIDDKARDFITKAHESAQHLGRLFQDLLDVSKAEDGRLSNNPQVVDVVSFVHDIVQGLTPKAVEKGLGILYKPLPEGQIDKLNERHLNPVFYLYVDNDHLREIVSNLVENAIKYTHTGDIVVDVGGDSEHVTISIADSGIGIPKEDQAHLFQKFYRVDNSDTREIGGTGLGLYLCRRLTEAMDGRIWVESEYKRGSTFFVEFPRLDHEEATRRIESSASSQAPAANGPIIQPARISSQPTTQPEVPIQPVEVVAQQAPQAVVQPPQPVAPRPATTPQPTPATSQAPVYYPPVTPQQQGAPQTLASIEKNPTQYIADRNTSINVPPRG